MNAPREGGWEEEHVGPRFDHHWDQGPRRTMTLNTWPWVSQLFLSPFHKPDAPDWGNAALSFLLEIVACIGLGLFVNLAKHAATGDPLVSGAVVGLIYGAYWYMAWSWTTDYMLRRHMNWAISLGYLTVGRCGIITWILYAGMQFAGAAIAGAILAATPYGTVPNITLAAVVPTVGEAWGWEFLGSFLIVFSLLYNEMRENTNDEGGDEHIPEPNKLSDNDTKDTDEDEQDNHERAGAITATITFILVTVFLRNQVYSFGNVIYFAGLIGTGAAGTFSNPADGFDMSFCHYLGTPLAGAVVASVVYWVAYGAARVLPDPRPRASTTTTAMSKRVQSRMIAAMYYASPASGNGARRSTRRKAASSSATIDHARSAAPSLKVPLRSE